MGGVVKIFGRTITAFVGFLLRFERSWSIVILPSVTFCNVIFRLLHFLSSTRVASNSHMAVSTYTARVFTFDLESAP